MKRIYPYVLLLLLPPLAAAGQQVRIDSLQRVIEQTKVDTVRGRTLCRLCSGLRLSKAFAASVAAGERGLATAINAGDQLGEALCHHELGLAHYDQAQYPDAITYFKRSNELYTQVDNADGQAASLTNLGNAYYGLEDYEHALACYNRSLFIRKALGDRSKVSANLTNIGNIHLGRGDFEQALRYYRQGYQIDQELGDRQSMGLSLNNIGLVYDNQGKYAQALDYYLQSLKHRRAIGDRAGEAANLVNICGLFSFQGDHQRALDYGLQGFELAQAQGDRPTAAAALNTLGNVYLALKEFDHALDYYRRSLALFTEIGEALRRASVLSNMGNILYEQKKLDQAVHHYQESMAINQQAQNVQGMSYCLGSLGLIYVEIGKPQEARAAARQALALAQQIGYVEMQAQAAKACYKADSALGRWQTAFEAARLYHSYSDSLRNDEQSKALGRLESKFEYDRQAEIERLHNFAQAQAQRVRFTWMLGSAAGGLLLLLIVAFTLYRSRQRDRQANAELRLLNQQINHQKSEIEAQTSEIIAQRDQLNATNQRLMELDRMKEQLTGMLVHDLKNPLNAILGMAALPPDATRLQIMRGAGQQMSQLVLNLLDIQKYEEAALALHPERHSARDLLREAIDQTSFLAEQKQIAFGVDARAGLHVEADGELLVRVLVNLLSNAIKYAPSGDVIEVQADYHPQRGGVFRVTDHGRGIPPDQLERIFDRFGQVDGGRASGKLRSTGLGLTFCRLTVEAHGGTIAVRSEVGRFTTFEFNLPHASLATETSAPSAEVAPQPVEALPHELRVALADTLNRLRATPLYRISDLLDELDSLPSEPSILLAWKAALEKAILAGNDSRFRQLLS